MSTKKNTTSTMSRIPVYCNSNAGRFRKFKLCKKERRIISHTTLNYGGVKFGGSIGKTKSRSNKIKMIEYKRNYYSSFVELKQNKIDALGRNQFHMVALTGTSITYSFTNVIAVKQNHKRRFFLINERSNNLDIGNCCFFAFKITPENVNTEILDYISLLNNFDESSIINYFDSFFKQKGGVRLNYINISEHIIFDLPDDLIDSIDFDSVPTIDLNISKPLKTNEVFLLNPINKTISFGTVSNGSELYLSSSIVCGGLIYSIWNLKNPIGINVESNKYIQFDADKFKQIVSNILDRDNYLIGY